MMDLLDVVSDFQLPATSGLVFQLSRWRGKKLVLYFYPKDATPGCTTQGMQFRDNYADFQALNTDIFGISR
ncbi:MAG: peroxiredoxin, partial [Methylophilaceae bacterium]|nr:peroxiredoxin [Methylophilaceae bacterium]